MAIKKKYVIEKRNDLNELRSNNLSIQELRFFSIYLAKINARDISTRAVRFSLSDFQKIMDFGRLNITQLQNTIDSLLSKVVGVPLGNKGFKRFQLFKCCVFTKDEFDEWYVEIDAHDDALPLMFEFKEKYFTYQLWNALKLKSSNQLRMYEILKQYEKCGERIVGIDELKSLLGIKLSEYERFSDFRCRVLDACQEALANNTDIIFTYETERRVRGGKITHIKFTIKKNPNHVDRISLEDFIGENKAEPKDSQLAATVKNGKNEFEDKQLEFISEACDNEFNEAEISALYELAIKVVQYQFGRGMNSYEVKVYDYIRQKYNKLKTQSIKTDITNRFGYLRKIIADEAVDNGAMI